MGLGTVTAAVIDSGPLIHLSEISSLELLGLFSAVYIPEAVWAETVGRNRLPPPTQTNLQRQWLTSAQSAAIRRNPSWEGLQPGEIECLILCRDLRVSLLLTDDLAVRRVAPELGVTPVGSLGIIVRAYRVGILPRQEAANRLLALQTISSLFVTRTLIDLAIEQLSE